MDMLQKEEASIVSWLPRVCVRLWLGMACQVDRPRSILLRVIGPRHSHLLGQVCHVIYLLSQPLAHRREFWDAKRVLAAIKPAIESTLFPALKPAFV